MNEGNPCFDPPPRNPRTKINPLSQFDILSAERPLKNLDDIQIEKPPCRVSTQKLSLFGDEEGKIDIDYGALPRIMENNFTYFKEDSFGHSHESEEPLNEESG